jgi:hypothetical protein
MDFANLVTADTTTIHTTMLHLVGMEQHINAIIQEGKPHTGLQFLAKAAALNIRAIQTPALSAEIVPMVEELRVLADALGTPEGQPEKIQALVEKTQTFVLGVMADVALSKKAA